METPRTLGNKLRKVIHVTNSTEIYATRFTTRNTAAYNSATGLTLGHIAGPRLKAASVLDKIKGFTKKQASSEFSGCAIEIFEKYKQGILKKILSSPKAILKILALIEDENAIEPIRKAVPGETAAVQEFVSLLNQIEYTSNNVKLSDESRTILRDQGINLQNFALLLTSMTRTNPNARLDDFDFTAKIENIYLYFELIVFPFLIREFLDDVASLSIDDSESLNDIGYGMRLIAMFEDDFFISMLDVIPTDEIERLAKHLEIDRYERPEYLQRLIKEMVLETAGITATETMATETPDLNWEYFRKALKFIVDLLKGSDNIPPELVYEGLKSSFGIGDLLPSNFQDLSREFNEIYQLLQQTHSTEESIESHLDNSNPLFGTLISNILLKMIQTNIPISEEKWKILSLSYAILWSMYTETTVESKYVSKIPLYKVARKDLFDRLCNLPGAASNKEFTDDEPIIITINIDGHPYRFELATIKSKFSMQRKKFAKETEIPDQIDILRTRCWLPEEVDYDTAFINAYAVILKVSGNSIPEISSENSKDTRTSGKANKFSKGNFAAIKTLFKIHTVNDGIIDSVTGEFQASRTFPLEDHKNYTDSQVINARRALGLCISFPKFIQDLLIEFINLSKLIRNNPDKINTELDFLEYILNVIIKTLGQSKSTFDLDAIQLDVLKDTISELRLLENCGLVNLSNYNITALRRNISRKFTIKLTADEIVDSTGSTRAMSLRRPVRS